MTTLLTFTSSIAVILSYNKHDYVKNWVTYLARPAGYLNCLVELPLYKVVVIF